MKRFLASLFALVIATQAALATTLPLTGAGAGGPTATPVSNACISSGGTTITFTAQGTGGANSNRITVVSINWDDSTVANTAELTAMTVGGISMARAVRAQGDDQSSNSEIWWAQNPTGTTANIVATFSTAVDGITIEVYSLIGYYGVPLATTVGTTTVSQGYNNKQVALAAGSRRVNVSTSLSNMTNDFSSACGSNLWGVHASQKLNGNNQTLTSTISPTSNTPLIALAVWNTVPLGTCTEASNFLARTSGLDLNHTAAYQVLICGLVTDGVWPHFDFLHVPAAQDSTTALLNLVSSSYPLVAHGSPTWTKDRGYTGVAGSTTVYLDTQFPPSTAGGQFAQNSAHIAIWDLLDQAAGNTVAMGNENGSNKVTQIIPKFGDGNMYFRMNGGNTSGTAIGTTLGQYITNRPNSSTVQGYKNANPVFSASDTSAALLSGNLFVLAENNGSGTAGGGWDGQVASDSGGSSLSATDAANYYSRMQRYLITLGAITSCSTVQWQTSTAVNISLSNNNLTATTTSASVGGVKLADACSRNSGKFYIEYTLTTTTSGGSTGPGIGITSAFYSSLGLNATGGVMMYPKSNGNIWSNGSNLQTLATRSSGDVIGMAIDLDNRKAWYRVAPSGNWNGQPTDNPATNTGGVTILAGFIVPFYVSNANAQVTTANFGASAFTGAVPSGFTSGWPAQ